MVTVALDPSQLAVLELPVGVNAAVIGAPGTGKTTTIIELVAQRVLDLDFAPEEVLVLTPTRSTASRLRDQLAVRIGRPTRGPLARTATSLAFDIARQAAVLAGDPPPTLLAGGDHDAIIRELLAGHIEDGRGPAWPDPLTDEVRVLPTFRTELRELMMRATDFGATPARLAQLGAEHGHQEWVAAAQFFAEYRQIVAESHPDRLDPAELMAAAAAAIDSGRSGTTVERLRLVVVDDLQEATAATLRLLKALSQRGIDVVAFGDPDVAANAFRGGDPSALGSLSSRLGLPRLVPLELAVAHRQGEKLRAMTAAVTDRIGTAAAGTQRRPAVGGPAIECPITELTAATQARVLQALARRLREAHLLDGVPWHRMAVVVRSGSLVGAAARSLELAEVRVRTDLGKRALRDDQAARSLLAVIDVAIGRRLLDAEASVELLLGPFGGLDRLALRRLRLALRAEELAGGGTRLSDELLVDALSGPGRLLTIEHRVARSADRLASTLAAVRALGDTGGSIEELLWLAWDRSGLARPWHEAALGAGLGAVEANRSLDGIVALFTAAKRFVERRPGDAAALFLEQVLSSEVPEDTLSPRSQQDSVLITTPPGVVGSEFEIVAVMGLQEGVWPNLRLRGSLLYPQRLGETLLGTDSAQVDERRSVLFDELRMFALAVSRPTAKLILGAVSNDDEAPSLLLGLLPDDAERVVTAETPALTLRALTGSLRRVLAADSSGAGDAAAAASGLARLASEGVPGADPLSWHGMLPISTETPLFDLDDPEITVPVSPSKVEQFEEAPLHWFVDLVAGSESSTPMAVGTIVHWVLETAQSASLEELWQATETRWPELLFESPWLAERQRRLTRTMIGGVAEYLADFERAGKRLVSAEGRFELIVDRARVRGTIDRIERHSDDSIVIVDLKTGSPLPDSEIPTHSQLGAYQLAYASGVLEGIEQPHRAGGAKLLFVKKGVRGKLYREGVQPPFDPEQLDGYRQRLSAVARGMASSRFEGLAELDEFRPGSSRYRLHIVRAVSSD